MRKIIDDIRLHIKVIKNTAGGIAISLIAALMILYADGDIPKISFWVRLISIFLAFFLVFLLFFILLTPIQRLLRRTTVPDSSKDAISDETENLLITGEIQDDWDKIIKVCKKGNAAKCYAIGAYKPLDLGEEFGTVNMQLAGFNLDERADGLGKAATTWIAKEILPETHRWNPKWNNDEVGSGTIGGWEKCELRRWINEMVLPAIPENVKDKLISVKKSQDSYDTNWNPIQQITEDSVWIPSYDEVFGDRSLYHSLFLNQADRRVKMRDGSAAWWWLRSAISKYTAGAVFGDFNYTNNTVFTGAGGVVIGFCL